MRSIIIDLALEENCDQVRRVSALFLCPLMTPRWASSFHIRHGRNFLVGLCVCRKHLACFLDCAVGPIKLLCGVLNWSSSPRHKPFRCLCSTNREATNQPPVGDPLYGAVIQLCTRWRRRTNMKIYNREWSESYGPSIVFFSFIRCGVVRDVDDISWMFFNCLNKYLILLAIVIWSLNYFPGLS